MTPDTGSPKHDTKQANGGTNGLQDSLIRLSETTAFKALVGDCPVQYTDKALNAAFLRSHKSNLAPSRVDAVKAKKHPQWMRNAFFDTAGHWSGCVRSDGIVYGIFAGFQPGMASRESIALTSLDGPSYMYSVDADTGLEVIDGNVQTVKDLLRKLGYAG